MDWHWRCFECREVWREEADICSACGADIGSRVQVRVRTGDSQNVGVSRDARLTIPKAPGRRDDVLALPGSSGGVDMAPTSSLLPSERSVSYHRNILPGQPRVVGPVFPPHRIFVVDNHTAPLRHASNPPPTAQMVRMPSERGSGATHESAHQQPLSRPQLRGRTKPAPLGFRAPIIPPDPPLPRTPEGANTPLHGCGRGRGGRGRGQDVTQSQHPATHVASYSNVLSQPAIVQSVTYKDPGEPWLPSTECSKANQDVWPCCFFPLNTHREGEMRQKVFPNCTCQAQSCGRPHPTKMHHLMYDFIEVWVAKLTIGIGRDTRCDVCGRRGKHATEDHDLGEWRDHHDTSFDRYVESRPYAKFARPWYQFFTRKTPFPREFFFEENVSADRSLVQYSFLKGKLQHGMWEVDLKTPDLGLEASLRKAAETHKWHLNVKGTPTHTKEPETRSQQHTNKAESADGTPALRKPARSAERAGPPNKEAKQGPAKAEAHQSSAHHTDLPEPGWYPDSDRPLNPAFINVVSRILKSEDQEHLRILVKEMKDLSQCRDATAQKVRIAKQTWELLEPYAQVWIPDYLQTYQSLNRELRDKLDQRAQERKKPTEALGFLPEFDGLSEDCGFVPREKHRVEWHDEDDRLFSDQSQFHPQVFPKTKAPAEAHLSRWNNFTLERCSEVVFTDFKSWYNDIPRSTIDAEITTLGWAKPELLDVWQDTARTIVDSMLSHVEELHDGICWERLGMKHMAQDAARMKAVATAVRSRFVRYAEQIETTLKTIDNQEAKGLGVALRDFATANKNSAWPAIRGRCLPHETPNRACIPRIAWPADFEKWRMEKTGDNEPWKGGLEHDAAESDQEI